jgi:hypothetical protein
MKKFIVLTALLLCAVTATFAQDSPKIKFDETSHNFGTFPETEPVQKCVFKFTNVGNQPLVINQAVASCGCTVPEYTKTPIPPGGKGTVEVTYNGKGKFPGHCKKSITIRTNGIYAVTRIYIEGNMTEAK